MDPNGRIEVMVSRPMAAAPAEIFGVLADPANHTALDGSGMLRGPRGQHVLGGVGDTFLMAMYLSDIGDYVMLNRVIAFERDRRIVWEPTPGDARTARYAGLPVGTPQGYSWGFRLQPDGDMTIVTEVFDCTGADQSIRDELQDGRTWLPAMRQTLERLATRVE